MPAVDQQLVDCVRHIINGSKPLVVGVVSQEESNLSERFGPSASVTYVDNLESLEKFSELDVLVVNEALEKELSDSDALDKFIASALHTLRMGGVLIIRQDLSKLNDPKKVAMLTDYLDVFRVDENGENVGLSFYAVNEVEDSLYAHQNWQDFIWTLSKKSFPGQHGENVTFRDFLDRTQYTDTGIFAYEWIFGDNFISPGGWDQNLAILKRFGPMKTGQRMLDIGVGIGGGARQAASEFGLHVHGVDLSANMLAVALDRVHKDKDARVSYAICDATEYDFQPASFDFVFSRDCIQHIEQTEKLFSRIYRALKPGGKVLITMYGVGYGALSESFKQYVSQRQYYLRNLKQIEEVAKKVGFVDIEVENMTPRFKEILLEERARVEDNKEEFLEKFSQREYDSLVSGWTSKLQYIADDNHNWNFFLAAKPL
ncbi:unnamed protein product [Nippostrongylus brasiliensis]|uniref:phosphoethanolamine N-methyltransferase n=1 Tax=Nippostrongylus brasiliensis TaxID=27835 RepID=A0A0N4Y1K8_NIPBR|nr:unnamed protein product [Nippostrongylus brasiliensis]